MMLMIADLADRLARRVADHTGATAVEYAVMLAAIVTLIMLVVAAIGQKLIPGFQTVNNGL